jgi:hypothetical protein
MIILQVRITNCSILFGLHAAMNILKRYLRVTGLAGFLTANAQVPLGSDTNFEGAQVDPVRISGDGTRLFALNAGGASLSGFDLSVALIVPFGRLRELC